MKITCQACQAKYTIADEKIQGKIAKIRCRKCGATVLVDASGGASAKGEASGAEAWLVSVADGDQRTMSLQEVAQAYVSKVISDDTYVWKDGMTDWLPLSEMGELVAACRSSAASSARATGSTDVPATAAASPVAARRDPGRAGPDLFGGGGEDEVATSVPPQLLARQNAQASAASADANAGQGAGLTGARDEHSVLFSLSALTGGTKAPAVTSSPLEGWAPTPTRNEDSGLIDLNALAQAQKGRFEQASEVASPAAVSFAFPAALGTVEIPREPTNKSRMPMFVGGSIALVGIVAAVVILAAGRKDEQPVPAPAASMSAAPVEPAASSLAGTAAPSTSASAEASASPDQAGGRAPRRVVPAARPQPGRAAPPPPVAAPVAPALPPPRRSPCGCAAGDLQCQIRCSAMGK
jgi:predicted Zn finger-like uncharacterized protein